tara:strand:- start:10 stop:423 length:414 start_codon:yes stop_codon:yes gene_type:complete
MTNSRSKGRSGEQEVARILRDELNITVTRNWAAQAHHGGCDLITEPDIGWGIEIKRAKEARFGEWWIQTANQAGVDKVRPVLIYRLDRQSWMAMLSLYDLRPDLSDHHQLTMNLLSWCNLVREELNANARELQTAQP